MQLERSFPEFSSKECTRIINSMYSIQGINILEMIWYSVRGIETVSNVVEVEGIEHYDEALELGRGAILLAAHISNYELIPMVMVAHGYKLSSVVKVIKNSIVNDIIVWLRSHEGLTFLPPKNVYRECLKVLRRNEIVGMVVDQNMTRREGIMIDFFGHPASTSPGLAYMAAQSKAPVIPTFILPKPEGGFKLKIHPLIEPPEDRTPDTIRLATQEYNKIVEDAIRETPEQWIWMHRRWRTQAK